MTSQFTNSLPRDFVWGAATASYQIEGAAHEDGRGESVWDRFCATPGKVRNGDDGGIACDFYHRYHDDIALMRELGLDAFRFSIAWPRVLPEGRGRVNEKGLDFYDRLVDELLGSGITPFVTLFHWDTPQVIEDAGGWPSRDTVEAFCEYVEAVAGRLGDRVTRWITHNEPWVVSWVGHAWGHHAPGRKSDPDALATAHHLLLTHGRAVDILRRLSPGSEVGITLNLDHPYPATDDEADAAAARWVDGLHNRWFLDPIFHTRYPADMAEEWAPIMPTIHDGDLETIAAPIDFLGINNYTSPLVAADDNGGRSQIVRRQGVEHTDMGWEIVPDGLHDLLVRVHGDYERASAGEIAEVVRPALDAYLLEMQQQACHDVQEAEGHHAVAGIDEAWTAARAGRGHQLVVEQSLRYPARAVGDALAAAPADGPGVFDAVEVTLEEVIRHGGDVVVVPDGSLAGSGGIALLTRY